MSRRKYKRIRQVVNGVQPVLRFGRSKFDLSFRHLTSMNVGDLCPVYLQEIYPGDTFKCKTTFLARTTNPYIRPVMDNLYMDIYFFFVPNRLVYSRWAELNGENVTGHWKKVNTPEAPTVALPYEDPDGGPAIAVGTVADYFGIEIEDGLPVGSTETPFEIQDIPFRANALVYNEWFRNQNFEDPVYINTGDYLSRQFLNNNAWSASNFHGMVPKVNRIADYFANCLPEPQKGDAVDIPIAGSPVIAQTNVNNNSYLANDGGLSNYMRFAYYNAGPGTWANFAGNSSTLVGINDYNFQTGSSSDTTVNGTNLTPNNLVVVDSAGNINDLRFAFQLQKMLERDASGGTRYTEVLLSHFGVSSPDARLQRPEFLGGKRCPLQVQEVAQTTPTDSSPLAQLSAYSATINNAGFSKGFVEHGFVIGYGVIRQKHTYQQGLERFWTRKKRYDYYDPVFANIGEQPVYRYQLYANGLHAGNAGTIFGYSPAWEDLRMRTGKITGALNSTKNTGFDTWHFGDYYATAPVLGNTWMKETADYVDRTLSVPSTTAPNFIVDFYFKNIAARVLPLYSVPGLVDHH